jgi:hypothetical protein
MKKEASLQVLRLFVDIIIASVRFLGLGERTLCDAYWNWFVVV